MIVRQTKRQQGANRDLAVHDDGLGAPLPHAEDCDLGRVNDRGEMAAADAPLVGDRKSPTLKLLEGNLTLPGLLSDGAKLAGDIEKVFLVGVAQHRDDQAGLRI